MSLKAAGKTDSRAIFDVALCDVMFGRRPFDTVAWGNAPGIDAIAKVDWLKAISTTFVLNVSMAFGQTIKQKHLESWGVAPGYDVKRPSAIFRYPKTRNYKTTASCLDILPGQLENSLGRCTLRGNEVGTIETIVLHRIFVPNHA